MTRLSAYVNVFFVGEIVGRLNWRGSRRDEVARIVGLGATHRWDVLDEFLHVQWTTLADPEGKLSCMAEHPPLGT